MDTGFHLSWKENIFLNATIYRLAREEIENKIEEIIHFSGVKKFITLCKKVLFRNACKIRFAVAANLDPDIGVDEVLALGDAYFQKKALQRMKLKEEKKKRTIIFVSVTQALKVYRGYFNKGKIVYDGKPSDFN